MKVFVFNDVYYQSDDNDSLKVITRERAEEILKTVVSKW